LNIMPLLLCSLKFLTDSTLKINEHEQVNLNIHASANSNNQHVRMNLNTLVEFMLSKLHDVRDL
jgi:hypothetical protein